MVVPMPMILPGRCRWSASNPPADAVCPKPFNLPTPYPLLILLPQLALPVQPLYGRQMVVPMPMILPWLMPMVRFQSPSRCSLSEAVQPTHPIPSLNITAPTCSPCPTAARPAIGTTHANDSPLADADRPLPITQLMQSVRSCSTCP